MPISHEYRSDDGILYSRAKGVISAEEGLESHRRVAGFLERHSDLKLVADMREGEVAASPTGVLELMEAFFAIVGPRVPVAFVVREEPSDPNPMLAQTQAYIEGARMRSFSREGDAVAWLKAGAPQAWPAP
tara:strand:+ start:9095 stop:9487 length:393 start_codon:yes stop_codon:yes gene_type:complete